MSEHYYSRDYGSARERFVAAARRAGATVNSYSLEAHQPNEEREPLAIDVSEIGDGPRLVIVSSGLHGIEGFFGSAVQLALLEQLAQQDFPCRLLLIHAINPWGFQHLRRVNEDNVDLNRNFRRDPYAGASAGYCRLNSLLNPTSVPSGFEAFHLRAVQKILRYGMAALKESVASGQYEYPKGLFYGGSELTNASRLVAENIHTWVGDSVKVLHVDLHTGLGDYGQLRLLCNRIETRERIAWYQQTFGTRLVESLTPGQRTAYPVAGQMGEWLQSEFIDIDYRFIGAEYGTYSSLRVVRALRAENRFHYYSNSRCPAYIRAKGDLLECFCPADKTWRKQVLSNAVSIVKQGAFAL